jgi:HSP20 family molecular chaperone IbpA
VRVWRSDIVVKETRTLMQILNGIGDVINGLSDLVEHGTELLQTGDQPGRKANVTYGWSIKNVTDRNARKGRPARGVEPARPFVRRSAAVHEVFDEGEFVRTVIELPGVVPDQIRFEMHGQELTVHAQRRDGPCVQRLIVPVPVCAERAVSSYRNGMFEIQFPKRGPAAGRAASEAEQ